jgi:hypothetical protein
MLSSTGRHNLPFGAVPTGGYGAAASHNSDRGGSSRVARGSSPRQGRRDVLSPVAPSLCGRDQARLESVVAAPYTMVPQLLALIASIAVRNRLRAGGRWIRTLGPPATVDLGSAGGARRDRCHPGTPIVRVDEFGERFPHARRAFHMDKSRRRARDRLPRLRASGGAFSPSRQRWKSVGTTGLRPRQMPKIADESGIP